jgi:hypothetical protein
VVEARYQLAGDRRIHHYFLQLRMLIGQCHGPAPFWAIWPDMGAAVDMEQALSIALSSDFMSITLFRRLPVLGYTDQ